MLREWVPSIDVGIVEVDVFFVAGGEQGFVSMGGKGEGVEDGAEFCFGVEGVVYFGEWGESIGGAVGG